MILALAKEKKSYSSWKPIQSCFGGCSQQSSESPSIGYQRKSLPQFIGFILLLCFMLQGPASWFTSRKSENRVWDFFSYKPVSAQQLALQATELQETKETCATISHQEHSSYYMGARYYDPVEGRFISADPLGHSASISLYDYCGGDPVNGLDPDGRCKQGWNDGWSNGDGGFAENYNPSTANNQTTYNLAWGLAADIGDINAVIARPVAFVAGGIVGIGLWGVNSAIEAVDQHLGGSGALASFGFMAAPLAAVEAIGEVEGVANNVAVREMYLNQLNEIPAQINTSLPIREQAIQAFNLRNAAKVEARAMMTDRKAAALLDQVDPVSTIQNIVRKVYKEKGLVGDDLWNSILESSTRSRSSVNQALGVGN